MRGSWSEPRNLCHQPNNPAFIDPVPAVAKEESIRDETRSGISVVIVVLVIATRNENASSLTARILSFPRTSRCHPLMRFMTPNVPAAISLESLIAARASCHGIRN